MYQNLCHFYYIFDELYTNIFPKYLKTISEYYQLLLPRAVHNPNDKILNVEISKNKIQNAEKIKYKKKTIKIINFYSRFERI